jgi:flagellar motor switch/type III secretory pathway protein FliN
MKELILVDKDSKIIGTLDIFFDEKTIKDGSIVVLNKIVEDGDFLGIKVTEIDKVPTSG